MMRTNPPLDREILLRTIDECASGSALLDNRSIQRIMQTLSRFQMDARDADRSGPPEPVPLVDVAAYVDGTLSEQRQLERITKAAVVDPGLLMEIVLARCDRRAEAESSLGSELRDRLLAMPISATARPATPLKSEPAKTLSLIERSVAPASVDSNAHSSGERNIDRKTLIGWMIAVSAALLLAIGTWRFLRRDNVKAPLVEIADPIGTAGSNPSSDPSSDVSSATPQNGVAQFVPDDVPKENKTQEPNIESNPTDFAVPPMLAGQSPESQSPVNSPASQNEVKRPRDATTETPVDTALANVPKSPNQATLPAMEIPGVPLVSPGTNDPQPPGFPSPFDVPAMQTSQLVATWSQIDGVLVRRDPSRGDVTSTSAASPMESIRTGSSFKLVGESLQAPLSLRTLPLCRAVAELDGGGKLVVAGDTLVEASVGGTLNLHYGSIALLDVNERSTIRIGASARNSVSVSSRESGSLVVRRTPGGLEIDAAENTVLVNGESFANTTVRVDGDTMKPQPMGRSLQRLPKWTRQRVDRIELGRNVLAQLTSSNDIQTSLAMALGDQDPRSRAAETLRMWLVESSSGSLLRLISSGDPVLREIALNHMRSVRPENPKHGLIWRAMTARSRNPRTLVTMRAFFVNLWSNERPIQSRREQLLRLLQASDPASRATADYLLRAFYGPGPAFDMNANAQVRARTINAWRTVISRVDG